MELWLIRHPLPLAAEGICYGRLDLAVAEAETAAAAERLRSLLPADAKLFSSPARRCLDLARRLHAAPLANERLLERSFGEWEGLRWEAIGRPPLDAWAADPWDFAPPGGESARMLMARVAAALAALDDEGINVWVTHQGVARAAAGMLLELPAEEWMALQLPFGAAWCLTSDGETWAKKEIAAGD